MFRRVLQSIWNVEEFSSSDVIIAVIELLSKSIIAWKVSKYGVFFGPYFPVFGLNTGKYRAEKSPYLDTFHAVHLWNWWN